jgi:hypothetical protein
MKKFSKIAGVNQSLTGYYQYFGVTGNFRSMENLHYKIKRIIFRNLSRRSQRRKLTWEKFGKISPNSKTKNMRGSTKSAEAIC